MATKPDLTNSRNFYNWIFYGLTATITTISSTMYFDMKKQRDEAIERERIKTDQIWARQMKIEDLKQENKQQAELIKYADSTVSEVKQMIRKP